MVTAEPRGAGPAGLRRQRGDPRGAARAVLRDGRARRGGARRGAAARGDPHRAAPARRRRQRLHGRPRGDRRPRYVVSGVKPTRWVRQTDFANDEAVGYLADRLARLGVEDALVDAGARAGRRGRRSARATTAVSSTGSPAVDAGAELLHGRRGQDLRLRGPLTDRWPPRPAADAARVVVKVGSSSLTDALRAASTRSGLDALVDALAGARARGPRGRAGLLRGDRRRARAARPAAPAARPGHPAGGGQRRARACSCTATPSRSPGTA